jgi:hypothetical protein
MQQPVRQASRDPLVSPPLHLFLDCASLRQVTLHHAREPPVSAVRPERVCGSVVAMVLFPHHRRAWGMRALSARTRERMGVHERSARPHVHASFAASG